MCSIGHLLHVNSLSVRIVALSDDKLSSRTNASPVKDAYYAAVRADLIKLATRSLG